MSAEIRIGNETTGLLLQETLSEDLTAALPALVYDSSTGEVLYRDVSSSGGVTPTSNFMYWDSGTTSYIPYSTIQPSTALSISSLSTLTASSNNINRYLIINGGLVAGTTYSGNNITGISAYSNSGTALRATSVSNYGIYTTSTSGIGLYASSASNYAINAVSNTGTAISANGSIHGVYSISNTGFGLLGATVYGTAGYFTKQGTITANNSSDTVTIVRNITGTSYNNTGALLKVNDVSTSTTGTISGKLIDCQMGSTSYFYVDPRGTTGLYYNGTTANTTLCSIYNNGTQRFSFSKDGMLDINATNYYSYGVYLHSTDSTNTSGLYPFGLHVDNGTYSCNVVSNGIQFGNGALFQYGGGTPFEIIYTGGDFIIHGTSLILQNSSGGTLSFFNGAGSTKPTITGSKGGNAALTSLLTALANLGLITNSTT